MLPCAQRTVCRNGNFVLICNSVADLLMRNFFHKMKRELLSFDLCWASMKFPDQNSYRATLLVHFYLSNFLLLNVFSTTTTGFFLLGECDHWLPKRERLVSILLSRPLPSLGIRLPACNSRIILSSCEKAICILDGFHKNLVHWVITRLNRPFCIS